MDYIYRVFVTELLDSKLDWNDHINIIRNKIAKHVSVMNRASSALNILYCMACLILLTVMMCGVILTNPASNHCIFNRKNYYNLSDTSYKCHTKPLFYQLRSPNVVFTIDINSSVFMYKTYHILVPTHVLCVYQLVLLLLQISCVNVSAFNKM